jgi:hypothetical protein
VSRVPHGRARSPSAMAAPPFGPVTPLHRHGSRQHIHFLTDLAVGLIAAKDTPPGFAAAWRTLSLFAGVGRKVLRTPTPAKRESC